MSKKNVAKKKSSCNPAARQTVRPFITKAEEKRLKQANKTVRKYMLWSMAAGLIPFPLVDAGTVSFIQLKMLASLSWQYRIPFARNLVKSLVAALLGFVTVNTLRVSLVTSLLKALPHGAILGAMSMPIYSGAATYAVGRVFVQHFEAGGTFLNFNPNKVKQHFSKLYQEGLDVASDLKK
ncbi:MAG: DUF697 domain-containing protein [bacterium]|nr:DUF697 domain-containing protein [bacterium]